MGTKKLKKKINKINVFSLCDITLYTSFNKLTFINLNFSYLHINHLRNAVKVESICRRHMNIAVLKKTAAGIYIYYHFI